MSEKERNDANTGKSESKQGHGKRILLRTFGCQMNDRDSEALAGLFLAQGYILTSDAHLADVILVNTCSVREHAENRAISFLGSLKKISRSRIIGLIGCMAKRRGEEIAKRLPYVNLICSPGAEDKIFGYVEQIRKFNVKIVDIENRPRLEEFYSGKFRLMPGHGQVVISTGCSNHCSYCVVPGARGEIHHRNPENILAEIKQNTVMGNDKITLLGQNVNSYQQLIISHKQKINFVDLLKMAADVEGVSQIDFISAHPKNTSIKLFELMVQHPKIKKQIHLPFQSGSDKILHSMNRGYTKQEYLTLIESYKKIVNGNIGTDIIVGYPGETEKDFQETLSVVKKVCFDYAFIFTYSLRPNTPAARLADDVPQTEKKRRHKILLDLQKKNSTEKAENRKKG